MKPTEKAALWASVGGLIAGFGLAWLIPGAVWWIPVGFGCLVAGGLYSGIVQQMAAERIADGNFVPEEKR